MLRWNEEHKVLEMSRIPLEYKDVDYVPNENKASYDAFIQDRAVKLIEDTVVKPLLERAPIILEVYDFLCYKRDNDTRRKDHEYQKIKGRLIPKYDITAMNDYSTYPEFDIITLPRVLENGVLQRFDRKYMYIEPLNRDYGLSLAKSAVTDGRHLEYNIDGEKSHLVLKYSAQGKSINLITSKGLSVKTNGLDILQLMYKKYIEKYTGAPVEKIPGNEFLDMELINVIKTPSFCSMVEVFKDSRVLNSNIYNKPGYANRPTSSAVRVLKSLAGKGLLEEGSTQFLLDSIEELSSCSFDEDEDDLGYPYERGRELQILDSVDTIDGTHESYLSNNKTYMAMNRIDRPFDFSKAKEQINPSVSLDRSKGYRLALDVYCRDSKVAERSLLQRFPRTKRDYTGKLLIASRGAIITSTLISKMKAGLVNRIYVEKEITEYNLCLLGKASSTYKGGAHSPVFINSLPVGLKVSDSIRELAEDYGIMLEPGLKYLDREFTPKGASAFFLGDTLRLDDGLIELLQLNYVNDIVVCNYKTDGKRDTKTARRYSLLLDVVSNDAYKYKDIYVPEFSGREDIQDNTWIYYNDVKETFSTKPDVELTYDDLASITSLYTASMEGHFMGAVTSVDVTFRKRVTSLGDSIESAIERGASDFFKMFARKLQHNSNREQALTGLFKPTEIYKLFVSLSNLVWDKLTKEDKLLNEVSFLNPISFMSTSTKVNTIVKNSKAIANDMRYLSQGNIGRLCLYETPQSGKMGVVNNRASKSKVINGKILTPFYKVLHHDNKHIIDRSRKVYMSAEESSDYVIVDLTAVELNLKTDNWEIIDTGSKVLAKVPSENTLESVTMQNVDVEDIQYTSTSVNQSLGYAATTIPFAAHNEAARYTFGINMATQSIPVIQQEIPLVMTSAYINIPRENTFFGVLAEEDGIIVDVTTTTVSVEYFGAKSGVRTYEYNNDINNTDVILRRPTVVLGQEVRKGDTIIASNFVIDGKLAMGKNLFIGYIPTGYNYEDGVDTSEKLIHKLQSYTPKTEIKKHSRRILRREPVELFKYKTKGKPLYKAAVKESIKAPSIVQASKTKGFFIDVSPQSQSESDTQEDKITTIDISKLTTGDKEANRHGNKTTSALPKKASLMYKFANGIPLDICYNQHGITSRMNPGQVVESKVAFASYILGIKVAVEPFDGPTKDEVDLLFSAAYDLANSVSIEEAESVLSSDKYRLLPYEVKDSALNNYRLASNWAGCFTEECKAVLYDSNNNPTKTEVDFGINYIYKLVQQSEQKINVRGTALSETEYQKIGQCPTKGKSKEGGQSIGTMELDALIAYGASDLIYELYNERYDNPYERNNALVDILGLDADEYKVNQRGIRQHTLHYLSLTEALGIKHEATDGELPDIIRSTQQKASDMVQDEYGFDIDDDYGDLNGFSSIRSTSKNSAATYAYHPQFLVKEASNHVNMDRKGNTRKDETHHVIEELEID